MRFLWAVAVLSVGCFSKPELAGPGPGPDASNAAVDGAPLRPCAWQQFSNLLTYLPLDEGAGAAQAVDRSAAMNHGTPFNVTFGNEGKIGSAASFPNMASSRVQLDSQTAFDDLPALTACAWIYLDRLPLAAELASNIVDKSLNGYDNGWNMYVEVATGPRLGFLTPYGHHVSGQPTVETQVWMHLCVSWDGSDGPGGVVLYRNGVVDPIGSSASLNHPARQSDEAQPIALGHGAQGAKYVLFGKLDEFFLFDAVLAPEAIRSLYECAP